MTPLALAVDGGNSKTDLAVIRADGTLLGHARGSLSSPHHLGLDGALAVLEELLELALASAGLPGPGEPGAAEPPVAVAHLLMAGVDFPSEERELRDAIAERGWASSVTVANDTFAVLRAGTGRGWGVAVVCGAGINCVGVAPDGRRARFPALGTITGDWGGGYDLGLAAVWSASRSQDGRGQRTSLERGVPAQFGFTTPLELAEAIHRGRLPQGRVSELAPLVLAAATAGDAVAVGLVDRLASEVVELVRVAIQRLGLQRDAVEVLLGGGLMRSGHERLIGAIVDGVRRVAPAAVPHVTVSPPIVGAALLCLDELGSPPEAAERARRELSVAAEAAALGPAERRADGAVPTYAIVEVE